MTKIIVQLQALIRYNLWVTTLGASKVCFTRQCFCYIEPQLFLFWLQK